MTEDPYTLGTLALLAPVVFKLLGLLVQKKSPSKNP